MENETGYIVRCADKYTDEIIDYCVCLSKERADTIVKTLEGKVKIHKDYYIAKYKSEYILDRDDIYDNEARYRAYKYEDDFPEITWEHIWITKINIL